MKSPRPRLAWLLTVSACLAACTAGLNPADVTTPTTTTAITPSGSAAPPTTASPTTLIAGGACPEGDVMLADGRLLEFDRATADGTRIDRISWRYAGGCHVISIAFTTQDGAPATTPPPIAAFLRRAAGVLRIETGATDSLIVDQLVEEGLVERLFVPSDVNGNRFVDLILSGPAVARGRIFTSPARLEIEIQEGGPAEVGSPLITPFFVLVEPGSTAMANPVIDIRGYTRGEVEPISMTVLSDETEVATTQLDPETESDIWTAFDIRLTVGEDDYNSLRLTASDGSVLAGIPFSPAP